MVKLENDLLTIAIDKKGAELQSISHREHAIEYLWSGDPQFWGRHAPVLFPIVGQLKDNSYSYQGRAYSMGRHGFAREMDFELTDKSGEAATFELRSSEDTRQAYPFDFILRISYRLQQDSLQISYTVINTGSGQMYFSIGGHPAFAVPLVEDTSYNDYYLEFNKEETASRWPLHEGLLRTQPRPCLDHTNKLRLEHGLFYEDAIVFKHLKSGTVSIRSEHTSHGVTVAFEGFPFLGVWAAPDAPFVCIEPWCGIADSIYHDQELTSKEGINELEAGGSWTRDWSISCF